MRRYVYETTTPLSAAVLFAAISDPRSWPKWDCDIEKITVDGAITEGASFVLRPKGGPNVRLDVEEFSPPYRLTDLARFPGGVMRTVHEYVEQNGRTRVRLIFEVFGPLAFVWDRIIVRSQVKGAADQTKAFLAHAGQKA